MSNAWPIVLPPKEPSLGNFALYLWRLSRPEVWYFSLVPMYIGYVLASKQLAPGLDEVLDAIDRMRADGLTPYETASVTLEWLGVAWPLLLGAFVLGPLLWTATLLINDVHDLAGDRMNPRKARSPLVQGLVSSRRAEVAAYVAAFLTMAAAIPLGPLFLLLTTVCVVLAWLYSAPPVRLKTVPGADVAVNIVGAGVVAGLAGWSLEAPLSAAPYLVLPQALLTGTAIYIPTALVDYDADCQVGYKTIATHLGRRRAFLVGWWAWVASNAVSILLAANGWFIPRAMLPFLLVLNPILLIEYWFLIGRAPSPIYMLRGITICSATFLGVNAIFALMYTGWWV